MSNKSTERQFIVYFIYSGDKIFYIGRTQQPLARRLHGHFHKKSFHRDIDPLEVDKVEYIVLDTQADMFLYEIYYINFYKPPYNCDDKANDELTCRLPEPIRRTWDNYKLLEKWKAEERERKRKRAEDLAAFCSRESVAFRKELGISDELGRRIDKIEDPLCAAIAEIERQSV